MAKFIQAMHMKKGALHKELGIPEGKKIPHSTLAKDAHAPGILGRRARLAETLEGLHHGGAHKNEDSAMKYLNKLHK